jgi:bacterioferritin-associated ferredoxin
VVYVCICNAIRETDLRRAARAQPGCAETLYASLGRTPKCRQCLPDAARIIQDERAGLCLA